MRWGLLGCYSCFCLAMGVLVAVWLDWLALAGMAGAMVSKLVLRTWTDVSVCGWLYAAAEG